MDAPHGTDSAPARITATVPAQIVELLRGALYAELMRSCEDAPGTMPESKTRAGWTPTLRRLDSAVSGLSAIGWVEPEEQGPLTISLDAALIEVLEADAEQWEWASEQERIESAEGRARAAGYAATIERFLASLIERPAPASLMIPVSAFSLLREGAEDASSAVSQAIDEGVDLRECCRRLAAICDLLDLIGWSNNDEPTAEVDATVDARTVAELAVLMVPTLMRAVSDHDHSGRSKATAEADLCLMRWLLVEAGGTADTRSVRPAD
jgi:hypothetical protein